MNKLFFNILGFCLSLVIAVRTIIFLLEPADTLVNLVGVLVLLIAVVGLFYWAKYLLVDSIKEQELEDPEENQ